MAKNNTENLPIVSVDPVSLQSYSYRNNMISYHNIDKSSPKKELYVSYLPTKDIISGIVEVSRRLDEEDIEGAIESEAYESLGLDASVEYKFIHLETNTTDSKNRTFNVFAFDSNLISKVFEGVTAKTSYIDYITAAPFLIGMIYEKKLLDPDNIDCFVYFQKGDAFLTIYQNGQYLYSKSLNYSLVQVNEKFCELMGERIDEEDFYNLLAKDGLQTTNVTYQQYLMQLFEEIFLYISDVLVFFKRSYGVESIDNIYIGTEIGDIVGMNEYSRNYLGIDTKPFNFNTAKNKSEWHIDQIQLLMMYAGQAYAELKEESLNLTIFKRPPPFSKRPSGILTMILMGTLAVALAYPLVQYGQGFYYNVDSSIKQTEYEDVYREAQKMRVQIAKLTKQKIQAIKKKNEENKILSFRLSILDKIHEKKVNYPMKGVILNELANLINKRDIKITQLVDTNETIIISLRSKSDKQLTELLKDISLTDKYKVNTDEIGKIKNKNLYESNVTTGVLK